MRKRDKEYQKKHWEKAKQKLQKIKENGISISFEVDEKNIKSKCVGCGKNLEQSKSRYENYGNYCAKCSASCYKNAILLLRKY